MYLCAYLRVVCHFTDKVEKNYKVLMNNIVIVIILSVNMFSCSINKKNEICFSETNFEIVYQYLDNKIATQDLTFYTCGNYKIHLISKNEIKIRNNGGTVAIVRKESGIFSLAKLKSDNERQLKKANEIFCQLVAEAEKHDK